MGAIFMAKQPKKKALSPDLTQEVITNDLVTWLTKLPDTDGILRKVGVKRHDLRKLLDDDEIFQAVETRVDALLSVPFRLTPSEGLPAEFLIDQLNKHINNITRTAINARFYGYSVIEAVWQKDGEFDIYRGLKAIIEKPMQRFDPKVNGDLYYYPHGRSGDSVGILGDVEFKFFATTNNLNDEQPYGTALLSRLYWPAYFRSNGWKFWAKFLERFGSPILVGKTGGDVQDMVNALLAAHGSAVVAVDEDDEVTALAPTSATGQAFDLFETALNRRINKVILGQTLTSGTDGGSGSRALGQVHDNVREDKRNSDIRLVLPTLQRVVNALCKMNGLPDHEITLADGKGLEKERADRDKVLKEIGVNFNDQYFQDEYNLNPEHFTVGQALSAQPVAKFSAISKRSFKFKADNHLTPEQQQVDALAPTEYSLINSDDIKKIVGECDTELEVQKKLFELLPTAPISQFNEILDHALFIAEVLGFQHSNSGK